MQCDLQILTVSIFILVFSNQASLDKEAKSTQTVLSSNGSICEAQDDYYDPAISFKKGELLQLGTNGHEIQSLETGRKSAVPMIYIGYSMVELLYLFQVAIMKEQLPVLLDDDEKVEHFIQKITGDPTLLKSLRKLITKNKCKYTCMVHACLIKLFLYTVFKASYNFEALSAEDLTLKKGLATIKKQ